jgi:hypothetical protein
MGRRKKSRAGGGSPEEPRTRGFRRLHLPLALVGVALLVAAAGGALLLAGRGGAPAGPPTAAIVDQLSLTQANPDFVASARSLLAEAGYLVDYYPGEQVTVDFYRNLPTHDYDLVILRVHSGIVVERDATTREETETEYVSLFTGEPYSERKYVEEQIGRLGRSTYYEGAPPLFGTGPGFIEDSMEGRFDNTLIVLMGCDGLRSPVTAQAFLDKGASAFVSWSETVSASHTDAATQRLLEKLFVEGLTVEDAVSETAAEVGPDPFYEAELRILSREG